MLPSPKSGLQVTTQTRLADSMARVIVPGGPFGLERATVPVPERRVLALELRLTAAAMAVDYCFTPTLGNRLVLHSIDVWAFCADLDVTFGGFFYLMFGAGIPVAAGDIAVRWSPIVPLACGVKPGFGWFDVRAFHRRFTMAKLFTTDELRFGVTIENGYLQAWAATVAFEISEG